jgi:hypothetical protein
MTPEQSRDAPRLLGWSQLRLAAVAYLPLSFVVAFEFGADTNAETPLAIRTALEAAGVEFIEQNGGGPGVRLKKLDT